MMSESYIQLPADDAGGKKLRTILMSGNHMEVVTIGEAGGDLVKVDYTGAIETIDLSHHEVHEGEGFTVTYVDSDADTTSGTLIRLSVVNTTEYHTAISVQSEGAGEARLVEVSNVSGYGTTALVPRCNNRVYKTSSTLLCYVGGYYTSGAGTILYQTRVGVGGPQKLGGDARTGYEWILASGNYLVMFNPDADNKKGSVVIEYYEHAR